MVGTDVFILVVLLYVRQLIHLNSVGDAVHSFSLSSCTVRACFLSSPFAETVVNSGAFKTTVCNYLVLSFTD